MTPRRHWHGHGDDVVAHPWLYEITTNLIFLGRRRAIYDDILGAAQLGAGDRVLDVGSGPGLLAKRAARRVGGAGQVTGIDPSEQAVAAASRRRGTNLAFEVATAEELPFDDQTFDVVVSMLALHHIGQDNLGRALSEMTRVLKPGGRLVVADFLADQSDAGRSSRRRHHPVPDLVDELAKTGLLITGRGSHGHGIDHVSAVKPSETEK